MRRADLRIAHGRAATIAAALSPDDTADLHTTVEDGHLVARLERPTAGSLQATIDDYLVNLDVAVATIAAADRVFSPDGDRGDTREGPATDGSSDGTHSTEKTTDTYDDTTTHR